MKGCDMLSRIKIRSIYSTALTRLFLDAGYQVVEPSRKIRGRFPNDLQDDACDIFVQDRRDLHGVLLSGYPENLCQLLTFLQESLLDTTLLGYEPELDSDPMVRAVVEFPGMTKTALDLARQKVLPTVKRHHQLRIVNSKALETAEALLEKSPEKLEELGEKLFHENILLPMEKSGGVKLEHLRPSGKTMRPREGMLLHLDHHRLTFKRTFSTGRYDGLDLPINAGDYGITEIREGSWTVRHSYFNKSGTLIGEYFNINTPVEFYPYGARYLDLEIDVVRRAGEQPQIIDQEKLSLLTRQGCIGTALEHKALEVAEELVRNLTR